MISSYLQVLESYFVFFVFRDVFWEVLLFLQLLFFMYAKSEKEKQHQGLKMENTG